VKQNDVPGGYFKSFKTTSISLEGALLRHTISVVLVVSPLSDSLLNSLGCGSKFDNIFGAGISTSILAVQHESMSLAADN
jgi:hypothetical protein